ncbi:MAG: methyltransferase domain-containing protein [Actinomycetota bacterium]
MVDRERRYTHGHQESVLRSHRWRTAENSAGYLLGELVPGRSLLDVGCGPGTLTADLADRVAPGRVVALDAAEDVLAEARATLDARGRSDVEVVVGDVYALDLPDDTFDVVHAHQVLQHLGDPVAALRELRRVARPGGRVAVRDADYEAMTWWPDVPELDRWLDVYRATARANGAEPDAGRRLLDWARQAGFADIEASASVWCFSSEADRRWWGSLWADRCLGSSFADQAPAHGLVDAEELDRIAAGWRRWADAPDGWFVVVHGEVIARP